MPQIIEDIATDDTMFYGDRTHYFDVGRVAIEAIRLAMQAAGKTSAKSILDLPSGHGRVLRFLKAEFPGARLAACDINRSGVDFCAEAFGARPIYANEDPRKIEMPESEFDLAWCGSLLTHFAAERWGQFLELFRSALAPGGLLVFTTHGRYRAEMLRDGLLGLGITDEQSATILEQFDREGFGYQEYPPVKPVPRLRSGLKANYGASLSAPSWVCAQLEQIAGFDLVVYREATWPRDGAQQDVVACVRVEPVFGPAIASVEDVARLHQELLNRGEPAGAAMVSVLAYAALLPSEVAGLRWSDVQDEHLRIGDRSVRLLVPLAAALEAWRGVSTSDRLVFPGRDGGHFRQGEWAAWAREVFTPAVKACGLQIPAPYDLHHVFCRLLLEQGASIEEVAAETGVDPIKVRTAQRSFLRSRRDVSTQSQWDSARRVGPRTFREKGPLSS